MKKAVFATSRDEANFINIWLNHYSQYFNQQDIYILDNNTVDGSTDNLDCNVIKLNKEEVDFQWLTDQASEFQHKLLENYEIVLYADIDEIVWHPKGLDKYIDSIPKSSVIRTNGYTIMHYLPEEPDLDLTKPILKQRKYWDNHTKDRFGNITRRNYCKPLLSNIPLIWQSGFHDTDNYENPIFDPELYLIHLHGVDYNTCVERHLKRSRLPWLNDLGAHGKLLGDELKERFMVKHKPINEQVRQNCTL